MGVLFHVLRYGPNKNLEGALILWFTVLNENYIKNHNRIEIIYKNETKFISLKNENRKVFTDEKLDYTIIEILDEDKIEHFFEIAQNINGIYDKDIFILQYLDSNELLFSSGKIESIEGNIIKHTCPTSKGASGSPIILRNSISNIIGLHFGSEKNKKYNLSTNINSIVNDIIKKEKSIHIIIGEIIIEKEDINKEIRIINSYDESFRERKFKIIDNFRNEKNIKDSCQIKINGNLLSSFQYFYKFQQEGKHIIKYSFSNLLPGINYMFSGCKSLTYIDLSNFNMENINNIGGMFYGCN
jgi:surface protein